MKKILILLFTLLLLVGCGQKTDENINTDNSETENTVNTDVEEEEKELDLSLCETLVLTINPEIKLYFDEDQKVVAYDYLNDDAQTAWDGLTIVGSDVKDVVLTLITTAEEKGYLSEDNSDISITLDKANEELSTELNTIITSYIDESELTLEASLTEEGQTVTITNKDRFTPGIYVADETLLWVPDTATYAPQMAIVFGDNNLGYFELYNGDPGYTKVSDTFTWTEDGNINFKFSFPGRYNSNCSFKYENGELIVYFPTEIHFVLNNDYTSPYGYRASGFEEGFYGTEKWSSYYEATFEDFMTDYNGINNNLLNLN